MVFGWTQILMDIQPLIVMISGEGHLHGFSHTYIGATLISVFAALTGKYLAEIGLSILKLGPSIPTRITWWVAFISAVLGSYSHVVLDSIMHADVQPFYPLSVTNDLLGVVSVVTLHKVCFYSGILGAAIYYFLHWRNNDLE